MEKINVRVETGQTLEEFAKEELGKPASVNAGLTLSSLRDPSEAKWEYLRSQSDIKFLLDAPPGTKYPGSADSAMGTGAIPKQHSDKAVTLDADVSVDPLAVSGELTAAVPEPSVKPSAGMTAGTSTIGSVSWKIKTVDVHRGIIFSKLGPAVVISSSGVDDLRLKSPFDIVSKKSVRAEQIFERYSFPVVINRLKSVGGLIPKSINSHDYSEFDSDKLGDVYAYEASLRRFERRATTAGRVRMPYAHATPGLGNEGPIESALTGIVPPVSGPVTDRVLTVLDYVTPPGDDSRIKAEYRIDVNPYRLYILSRSLKTYSHIVLRRDSFYNTLRGDNVINNTNSQLHTRMRLQDTAQYDAVDEDSERLRVYYRFYDRADMGRFYYNLMDDLSAPAVRSAVASKMRDQLQQYSYGKAQEFFSALVMPTASTGLVTSNSKGQTAWSTLVSTYITAAPSAEFIKTVSATLLGARYTKFSVQIDSPITGNLALESSSLAAVATLCMIDSRWLTDADLLLLISRIIMPFYDIMSVTGAASAVMTQVRTGAAIRLPQADGNLPPNTPRPAITAALEAILLSALSTTFTMMRSPRVFEFASQPRPYSAIPPPTGNATDLGFLLGTDRHVYPGHQAFVRAKLAVLEQYAMQLDKLGRDKVNYWYNAILKTPQISQITPSCAFVYDSMMKGMNRVDIVSGGVPVPGANNYDVVELPYYGALAFLLFGANTPYHTSPNDPTAIPYVHVHEFPIPDQTMLYYYYEQQVAIHVFHSPLMVSYINVEDHVLYKVIYTILEGYFSSVPSGFEDRMRVYFMFGTIFLPAPYAAPPLGLPPPQLPSQYQMPEISTCSIHHNVPGVDYSLYDMQTPGAVTNQGLKRYYPLREMVCIDNSLASNFYVSLDPVVPSTMFTKHGQKILVWCLRREPTDGVIDLIDLVRGAQVLTNEPLTLSKVRNLLIAYNRVQGRAFRYVRIPDTRFKYGYSEVKVGMDVVNEEVELKIVPKTYDKSIKYELGRVDVFWMMYNMKSNQPVLPNPPAVDPGLLHMALSVYGVCTWTDIVRRFANVQGPLTGNTTEFEHSPKRIFSGTGFTISSQMCVSMRQEQVFDKVESVVRIDPI